MSFNPIVRRGSKFCGILTWPGGRTHGHKSLGRLRVFIRNSMPTDDERVLPIKSCDSKSARARDCICPEKIYMPHLFV